MFGENIRLRSINAERTRCLNYCRQTNRCRNDARLLTRAMWILNWRYGFHARSSLLQLAAFPRGGLTPAEAPLIDAEILFRQPQPPHSSKSADSADGALSFFKARKKILLAWSMVTPTWRSAELRIKLRSVSLSHFSKNVRALL